MADIAEVQRPRVEQMGLSGIQKIRHFIFNRSIIETARLVSLGRREDPLGRVLFTNQGRINFGKAPSINHLHFDQPPSTAFASVPIREKQ
jgi:hypothetical protein